jgi:N-acetylglucosaminyldiphosphoundecaprenol N-acetyl-beta-D-mannosaminyltransferase
MTLILTFSIAAILTLCIMRLPSRAAISTALPDKSARRMPRAEGVALMAAVFAALTFGLAWHRLRNNGDISSGVVFLLAAITLYLLLLLRSAARLPSWIADIAIVSTAGVAIGMDAPHQIQIIHLPFLKESLNLGAWSLPLSVFWVWLLSRATATLNRAPQVTGGYLGLVALTLLLLYSLGPAGARTPYIFPVVASAALAGAGLMSVGVALRRPGFNMGWPAACVLGFVLAHITINGLFKGVAVAIIAPLLLLFGLPLLDVWFVRLRATQQGEVAWEKRQVRLHEALHERGISPLKVSMLYLVIAAYLCGLCLLMVSMTNLHVALRVALLLPLAFGGFVLFFSVTRVLMRRVPGEQVPEDIEAFGVRISPVSMTEALDKIDGYIESRKPHHVVTSDANSILRAQEDEEYASIIRRAALITPDGYGVMWGARLLNLPIYERVTGVDMVTGICERAARRGQSIYILGAKPGVASTAAEKLAQRFPWLESRGHATWLLQTRRKRPGNRQYSRF